MRTPRDMPSVVFNRWQLFCEMTSYTKPEVHNVLQWRSEEDRATPQTMCTENFAKFVQRAVFEIYKRTDRQTDRHAYRTQYFVRLPETKLHVEEKNQNDNKITEVQPETTVSLGTHYPCTRAVFTGRDHGCPTRVSSWTPVFAGRVHGRRSTLPVNTGR